MKTCKRCNVEKPFDLFKKDMRYSAGYSSYCKECHAKATVAWQKANPERLKQYRKDRYNKVRDTLNEQRKKKYTTEGFRPARIKYLYKMTPEKYAEMMLNQNGVCAICGAPPTSRALSIDHDHSCCAATPTCGKCSRGLLCGTCNTALHSIEHKEGWLENSIKYLTEKMDGKPKSLRSNFICDGVDG